MMDSRTCLLLVFLLDQQLSRICPADCATIAGPPPRREHGSWAAWARNSVSWDSWNDASVVLNGPLNRREPETTAVLRKVLKQNQSFDEPTVGHLPSFIIPGMQKCGTTFMRGMLDQHPNTYSGFGGHGKRAGEPHFFNERWGSSTRACNGTVGTAPDDDVRACIARRYSDRHFSELKTDYDALPPRLAFDTTPSYFHVVNHITELLPGIPLVVLLRDPVERYRSALDMQIQRELLNGRKKNMKCSEIILNPGMWPRPGKMQEHVDQVRHHLKALDVDKRYEDQLAYLDSDPIARGTDAIG